jgi:hypothetical protein
MRLRHGQLHPALTLEHPARLAASTWALSLVLTHTFIVAV